MLQPAISPVPATSSSTGRIEAVDLTGDSKVFWDKNNEAEVAAARASFETLTRKGYRAFRLGADGSTGEQIREFDENAERILMLPQMRGG